MSWLWVPYHQTSLAGENGCWEARLPLRDEHLASSLLSTLSLSDDQLNSSGSG